MAALLGYGYLVGGGASVNRATLMAVVYFAARAIDLRGPPLNVLALAAGLLVAVQPLAVVDPGLPPDVRRHAWPSWSSCRSRRCRRCRALSRRSATLLAASVAAETVLLPISAFVFSRVTFAGLLANFAAIPLMGVVQIAGILVVFLRRPCPSTLAAGAGWIAHVAAEGLVRSADVVTLVPSLTWRVAPPHWFAIVAYYGGLIVGWTLWRRRAPASRAAFVPRHARDSAPARAASAWDGSLRPRCRSSSGIHPSVADRGCDRRRSLDGRRSRGSG